MTAVRSSTVRSAPPTSDDQRLTLLPAYYLGTPVFAMIEIVTGWTFRLHLPGDLPAIRYAYYAVCFIAGVIIYTRPLWRDAIGLGESSVNIALLIISIMIGYYTALDAAIAGDPHGAVQPGSMVNMVLSATIFAMSYFRHRVAIATARTASESER